MLTVGDIAQLAQEHHQSPCDLARLEVGLSLSPSHVKLDEAILKLIFAVQDKRIEHSVFPITSDSYRQLYMHIACEPFLH